MEISSLLNPVIALAQLAGQQILTIYREHASTLLTSLKADNSPVTRADLLAHQVITNGLTQLTPDWPILSEEAATISFSERQHWSRYWLIDPLDGTKEFLARNDEFTINIALIEQHQPCLGVIHAPALEVTYFACQGGAAYKQVQQESAQAIHVRSTASDKLSVVSSRRHGVEHLQDFLQLLEPYTILPRGSALKCGLIAEGLADLYPRLGPTSEWDTAAGQCIVEAAGGEVLTAGSNSLRYNYKASLLNPPFIMLGNLPTEYLTVLHKKLKEWL